MAGENDSAILSTGLRLYRAIYARCREIAHAEVIGYLGQIIRGGRVQWPYQLPGHGYELTQHDTYTFTTTDIPANADTSAIVTVSYPIGYDTSGAAPDVYASSQDSDWIASATPNGSNPHTQIDLVLTRTPKASLLTPEWGTETGTIASGDTYVDVPVTFSPAFQSTPAAFSSVDNPLCRATLQAVSTTGATFRVTYVPTLAEGTVSNDTTGITVGGGPSNVVSSGGPSDNETDTTTTNTDSTGGPSTSNTSNSDVHHTHHIASPGTSTDTDDANPNHFHTMQSHTHGVGDHSHAMKHHTHGVDLGTPDYPVTDPGHTHTFTGSPEVAPGGGIAFTLHWQATGLRAAPAATVDVSWQAIGLQALPA